MANASGQAPTAVELTNHYITRVDYVGGTNPIYIGRASTDTTVTDTAVWQVVKITWDGNNNPILIEFADGNEAFDNIWNDRATLNYI